MFPSLCVNMPMLSREEGGVAGAPRALCHASSAMRSFICAFGRAFFVILSSTMRHLLYVLCYASCDVSCHAFPFCVSSTVRSLPCLLCHASFTVRRVSSILCLSCVLCHAPRAALVQKMTGGVAGASRRWHRRISLCRGRRTKGPRAVSGGEAVVGSFFFLLLHNSISSVENYGS